MLRITTRRIIQIPHSLAIAAAVVAVVTALGWSSLSNNEPAPEALVSGQSEALTAPHRRVPAPDHAKKSKNSGEGANRFFQLLPPFLPRFPEI